MGFILGHAPKIKVCVGTGRVQNNWRHICGIHQEWMWQCLEAPKFSSMLGMLGREGVGELLDLSCTGAAAGAGSREKSQWVCVCDAPHEPDQGIPHPSPSFPSQSSGSAG